jgi:ribokinase
LNTKFTTKPVRRTNPLAPKVIVVGSLNVDYIASVKALPSSGQTVAASGLIQRFGGKGANQAVAAARQGAKVLLVGCVGADDAGRAYRKHLEQEGIDVTELRQTHRAHTGTALIAVDSTGENTIIVAAGANGELKPKTMPLTKLLSHRPNALLLQFEIPMPSIRAIIDWADRSGIPVALNPSPLRDDFAWGKCSVDALIVNAGEAETIFRLAPRAMPKRLSIWRKALVENRTNCLIVTRGSEPTLCLSATEFFQVPTLKIKPVDTVGAGDAFAGTFVAHRARGLDLLSALRLANCAGALTTLKPGAQEAIPSRSETQRALRRLV